jgi:hypothetical protein
MGRMAMRRWDRLVDADSLIQMLPPGPSIAGMSTVWTVSEVVIVVNYAAIAWQYAPYYMAVRQDVKY